MIEDKKLGEDFRKYLEALKSVEKDKKEEEQIQKMRERYQYTPIIEVDKKKVDELLVICQNMIKDTKGMVM